MGRNLVFDSDKYDTKERFKFHGGTFNEHGSKILRASIIKVRKITYYSYENLARITKN
jgi:hypothetical protein